MTANEIYALSIQGETRELWDLNTGYTNHLPELSDDWMCCLDYAANQHVMLKTHKFINYDGRRFWRLMSVWFLGAPIMICQNAGREGDDYSKRFITDVQGFAAMLEYLRSLAPTADMSQEYIDPNQDIPELTSFYGETLENA